MAGHVYHWKHGWIPLDHEAALSHDHKLNPVAAKHLARLDHIAAGHKDGHFALLDRKTGHTTRISEAHAKDLHKRDHLIMSVQDDGSIETASHQAVYQAKKATVVAAKMEPQLTALARSLSKAHGGAMKHEEHRLKEFDSLARKLDSEVADANPPGSITITEALDRMFDNNRYTTVLPDESYTTSSQQIIAQLRDTGHTVKVKNFWKDDTNPYQGINLQVTDKNGNQFELQYHTADSFRVKEQHLHPLYKKRRNTKDPQKRYDLDQQMDHWSGTIPQPADILTLS